MAEQAGAQRSSRVSAKHLVVAGWDAQGGSSRQPFAGTRHGFSVEGLPTPSPHPAQGDAAWAGLVAARAQHVAKQGAASHRQAVPGQRGWAGLGGGQVGAAGVRTCPEPEFKDDGG